MFPLFRLITTFREGSARRSAVRTLSSLSAAQMRDLGIPSDGLDEFVGSLLTATHSRRAPAVAATFPSPRVAATRTPVTAAGTLQACG